MQTANRIIIGTAVTFDTDEGPQRGTVHGFKPDLSNGQKYALVKVPGTMNGALWPMPVDQLERATTRA